MKTSDAPAAPRPRKLPHRSLGMNTGMAVALLSGILMAHGLLVPSPLAGQAVYRSIHGLQPVDTTGTYLFYLHGGIVQARGAGAVSPYWGRYEYRAILDTLALHGFRVVSEVRPQDAGVNEYAGRVAGQIEKLLEAGVRPGRIVVLGASMGAGIALQVSIMVGNRDLHFALQGVCRKNSWNTYLEHFPAGERELCGTFLSIFERSDSYGSCREYIDESQPCVSGFSEIALDLGNGHGFLYKPYDAWVHPLVEWIRQR